MDYMKEKKLLTQNPISSKKHSSKMNVGGKKGIFR